MLKTKLYSMEEVAVLCYDAGFTGEGLVIALSIIWAESGGNAWAVNINSTPGKPTDGSLDLGIAQFNTYWWLYQKANDLMHPEFAIPLMFRVTKGSKFIYWSSYVHGTYKVFLDYARAVVTKLGYV